MGPEPWHRRGQRTAVQQFCRARMNALDPNLKTKETIVEEASKAEYSCRWSLT